jgi:predicted transcriptional regulator
MTFNEWVSERGGAFRVAELLGVTPAAVSHWVNRKAVPKTATIFRIVKLSGGKVTIAEIFAATSPNSKRGRK